jgi:hypothetical protein
MNNLRKSFLFLAVFAISICINKSFAQNAPYIPYNPNGGVTTIAPTKVYTNEEQEPITDNKKTDTIILMKNTISFHPAVLIDGTVALGYERVIDNRKKALRLILGYTALDKVTFYDSKVEKLNQFYIEANVKFFLTRKTRKAPVGLYASPYIHYRNASYNYHVEDTLNPSTKKLDKPVILEGYNSHSFSAGVMLGYSTIVLEMLTLEAYMGIGVQRVVGDYLTTYKDKEYKPLNSGFFWNNGPLFKLGCSIGVNF